MVDASLIPASDFAEEENAPLLCDSDTAVSGDFKVKLFISSHYGPNRTRYGEGFGLNGSSHGYFLSGGECNGKASMETELTEAKHVSNDLYCDQDQLVHTPQNSPKNKSSPKVKVMKSSVKTVIRDAVNRCLLMGSPHNESHGYHKFDGILLQDTTSDINHAAKIQKGETVTDNCHSTANSLKLQTTSDSLYPKRDNCKPKSQFYGHTELGNCFLRHSMLSMPSEFYRKSPSPILGDKIYQAYIGQIKLSIMVTSCKKKLEVNILQALDLCAVSTFVELSILTRSKCKRTHQTDIIEDNCNPKYAEKFTFNIKKTGFSKNRLLVTIYGCHHNNKQVTWQLGCMSFSVENLVKNRTVVDGWYYLLTEHLGLCKHMKVEGEQDPHCRIGEDSSNKNSECNGCIGSNSQNSSGYFGSSNFSSLQYSDDDEDSDDYNCDPDNNSDQSKTMQKVLVIVVTKKHDESYGMILVGGYPAIVSTVIPGSPADHAGVKVNDGLVKVNGESVRNMFAETVGKIIRHFPQKVVLELHRKCDF